MLTKIYIDRCGWCWLFHIKWCLVYFVCMYIMVYRTSHKYYLVNACHQKRQKWQPHRKNKGAIFFLVFLSPQHAIIYKATQNNKNHEFLLASQNLFEIKTQTIRMVEYTNNSKGLEKVQNFNVEACFYFVC